MSHSIQAHMPPIRLAINQALDVILRLNMTCSILTLRAKVILGLYHHPVCLLVLRPACHLVLSPTVGMPVHPAATHDCCCSREHQHAQWTPGTDRHWSMHILIIEHAQTIHFRCPISKPCISTLLLVRKCCEMHSYRSISAFERHAYMHVCRSHVQTSPDANKLAHGPT